MGYPERLLSDGEVIERQFRPHWSGILRECLIILAGIVVAIILGLLEALFWWAFLILIALVAIVVIPGMIKWATTLHVITDERVIYRAGFFAKHGTEIPLEVIQDVAFHQSLFGRIVGTGDLVIESAGTHGQTRYRDIPQPEAIQSLIYKNREERMEEIERGGRPVPVNEGPGTPPAPAAPLSVASQLDILSRLHDEGKLTDEEFESEKSRILGGGT